jgi:exonuclease VII small subunit
VSSALSIHIAALHSRRCCSSSPMGGKRQKGIGMNRAKKAKLTPVEPAAVEPESESEPEDYSSHDSPSSPEPARSPAMSATGELQLSVVETYEMHLAEDKAEMERCKKKLDLAERHVEKCVATHGGGKYSIYKDPPSVLARVAERIEKVELELEEATLEWEWSEHRYQRSYRLLLTAKHKRAVERELLQQQTCDALKQRVADLHATLAYGFGTLQQEWCDNVRSSGKLDMLDMLGPALRAHLGV